MSSKGPLAKRQKVVSEEEEFVPLPTLNDDCLVEIFKRLPLRKRIWMEQFCRHWKNDVVPKSLWNVKSLEISDFCRIWIKFRPNATNWHLTGTHNLRSVLDRIGNQLEVVSFAKRDSSPCQFDIAELTLLSAKCPNLKNLDLTSGKVDVTQTVLERLGTELSGLESLSLSNCRWTDLLAEQNLVVAVGSMSHLKELNIESKCGILRGTFLGQLPNSVVSLNVNTAGLLEVSHLAEFIRSHPGLKKFQMSWGANSILEDFDELCRQMIELLAENCNQLEQLSFSQSRSKVVGNLADVRSFADSFESLGQLKKVEINKIRFFNTVALESLCANCPHLEDLAISVCRPTDFGPDALGYVGELEKLKSLKMNLPLVNDRRTDALMTAIGATLEYLDIREAKLSDASLHQIGLRCSRLAHLVMRRDENVTSEGLTQLIDAIVSQESWNDRSKNRCLRIDVFGLTNLRWPTRINLNVYGDRVKINKF